jgi:hypothetical protein
MTTTRYEDIMASCSRQNEDALAAAFAAAAAAVRSELPATSDRDVAIRDVATGAAGPAFIAFLLWIETHCTDLARLCFLSRDGQVLYELAHRLHTPGLARVELRYLYSSRRTWNLAASDPDNLAAERWLYGSFMHANATDLCARLGLDARDFGTELDAAGVACHPDARADDPRQAGALARFVSNPVVKEAVRARIQGLDDLVVAYACHEGVPHSDTGLIDVGWTGKMLAALYRLLRRGGHDLPRSFFWGYEPQVKPQPVPKLHAWLYDSREPDTMARHVAEAPYVIETFSMADHGLVTGYETDPSGRVHAILATRDNPAAAEWGIATYRRYLYAFADALELPPNHAEMETRPLIQQLVSTFWQRPTLIEAEVWGTYVWDSDPTGTAARPLARPFDPTDITRTAGHETPRRGDRAWVAGSLALSGATPHQNVKGFNHTTSVEEAI